MIKQSEVLIRLQAVIDELGALCRNKEYRYNDIEKAKNQIKKKKDKLDDGKSDLKKIQMNIDNKEMELKCFEDDINKFKIQLNQVKTNKEYSALQGEIRSKETDKSVLEDEILVMMNELEDFKVKEGDSKNKIKASEDELNNLVTSVQAEINEMDKEIAEIEAKKESLLETLDKDARYNFDRLSKNKDGIAVASVVGNICQSCFVAVTPQTINLLLSDKDTVFCNSCGRILYLNDKDYVFQK